MEKYIPISEVAKKYNKTTTQVRYAISQGRLKGIKIGWCWFCNSDCLPEKWPMTSKERGLIGECNNNL